ncbi:MAG: sensor domain-containing diguanylate cyclase, partial [Candidatus Omnitrophica bacterium]|nr:sensor domain-containing diguanylate cyclase [Candidatus Omnitrophota bacterium]
LFIVNVEKQELMLSASKDGSQISEKKGDYFDHWVLRHRQSLFIEDAEKDFRFPAAEIENSKRVFRSLISVPLMSENRVIGILRMDNPTDYNYTQDDLRLLDIISDLAAVAVQNAFLYSRTQELAIRDDLTELVVRRYFMERFKEDIKRAARKKRSLSLLILDIDNFKNYNDRYGHAAGDLVLKHMAREISSMVREGDIIARYGGEEMALLLFGMNKKEAALEAEAIRKRIEKGSMMLRRQKMPLTVSIGLSSYPEDAGMEEELIKIADERLYKAKKEGRNRVCSK